MSDPKIKINGFLAEMDRSENINCYISKGQASASLACLIDTGCLQVNGADEVEVHQETIDRIEAWALLHGY